MLKKMSLILCAAAHIFSCSDETTEEPTDLKGELKGQVYLLNEFGRYEFDQSGVSVSLEGSTRQNQTTTDADGKFGFQNLALGTYNLIAEKSGYISTKLTGVRLAGGSEPSYQFISVVSPSTTKLDNISLSVSVTGIIVKGTLLHTSLDNYTSVRLAAFLSTSPDVSSENHIQSADNSFLVSSGSTISWVVPVDPTKFSKGTKVYIKVYGLSSGITRYFNYDKKRYDYLGLSNTSSGTVSIVL